MCTPKLCLGSALICLLASAQEFEVATIKPVEPNVPHYVGVKINPGGRVVISTMSLKALVGIAFHLSYWQISGGDAWTGTDEYNVEAKPPANLQSTLEDLHHTVFGIANGQLRQMLQALLIDRFQLKFHRETNIGDVYLLKRNGKPLRLHPSDKSVGDSVFGSVGYAGGKWNISDTSMSELAKFASDVILHVPVLDRTDLDGRFDYRQRQPDLDPRYSGDQSDSFRSYLRELGLKLESTKGPVETFVIDHAEKPLPN